MGRTSVDIGDILRLPCSSDKSAVSGFEFAGTFKTLIPSADETESSFPSTLNIFNPEHDKVV